MALSVVTLIQFLLPSNGELLETGLTAPVPFSLRVMQHPDPESDQTNTQHPCTGILTMTT